MLPRTLLSFFRATVSPKTNHLTKLTKRYVSDVETPANPEKNVCIFWDVGVPREINASDVQMVTRKEANEILNKQVQKKESDYIYEKERSRIEGFEHRKGAYSNPYR